MAIHIATVENLAAKCKQCGDPKSDIITKLLDRIPVEYSTVHVAMSLAGADRQNLDTVKRLLLSEKLRIGQLHKDNKEALYVKKGKQANHSKTTNDNQSKNKRDKQCFTCGETGHFSSVFGISTSAKLGKLVINTFQIMSIIFPWRFSTKSWTCFTDCE